MNIFIAAIYNYNSYSRGIMPDVLQAQLEEHPGAKIYYLTNSNSFNVCYFNINKRAEICYRCKTGVKNTLSLVEGDFCHLTIADIIIEEDKEVARKFFRFKKTVRYEDVFENFKVGEATLSTYISKTRDRDLKNVKQDFVKELATNALSLFVATKRFFKENDINIVYNFNGRHEYVRAIMSASLSMKIECINVERARFNGYLDFYKNSLPHDPGAKFDLVEKYWRESSLSEEEKKEIGASFYLKQGSGESTAFPSYTGKMKKGLLPADFQNGRKNLVLFHSSDDEIAAFGDLFRNPYFKDQNEGLIYLSDLVGQKFSNSHNLIIRMHPNQAGLNFAYVKAIKELHQKFSNIYVIPPESDVDSYALMQFSDKVISFGSTTGLEANFMRKPVILLGIGYFFFANYSYKPFNRENIESMLKSELVPKPLLDTLKVGYFFLKGGEKALYYNEESKEGGVYFKNKKIPFFTIKQRLLAKLIELSN